MGQAIRRATGSEPYFEADEWGTVDLVLLGSSGVEVHEVRAAELSGATGIGKQRFREASITERSSSRQSRSKMQDTSQKHSSESLMAKKVQKEELEEKVDGTLLDLLEQRTGFPKLIAECVTAANRATEQAMNECEIVGHTYRPPSVDFERLANEVREALNDKRKAEKCEARLSELKQLIETAKQRESLLREAIQSGRYVPL